MTNETNLTLSLEDMAKILKTIQDETIFALEIGSDFGGRYWTTGTYDKISKRLDNLSEDEYFSDLDVCSRQENPICKNFYYSMYDYSKSNPHNIFDTRFYLPFYLFFIKKLNYNEVRENDELLLNELLRKIPKEYSLEKVEKDNEIIEYRFVANYGKINFKIKLPLILSLTKEINEEISCEVQYDFGEKENGFFHSKITFEELITFMEKTKNEEYWSILVDEFEKSLRKK